jgi:hypothetical protein
MIEVSRCVVCDGELRHLRKALVSPFLATRIWSRPPFCVDLMQCQACGFTFYNPRLSEEEAARLYSGYRSPEYQQMRHASEPWYTEKFNSELASLNSYDLRRTILKPILRDHLSGRTIRRVLDYGGDRGDLVVGLVEGAKPFVYEISGIPPADGVTSVTDPTECKADLIVNSNVLEHVGFPRQFLQEIVKIAQPGCLIFVEVPCESPFGLLRIMKRIAQIGVMALTRPVLARYMLSPASLYMMHEHINYYTEQSLATAMHSAGCSVEATGTYVVDNQAGRGSLVWCLGIVGNSEG